MACGILLNYCYLVETIKSWESEDELVETICKLIPLTKSMNMGIYKVYIYSNKAVEILDRDKISTKVTFTAKDLEIESSKSLRNDLFGQRW